jgi:hypothetical protein
MKIPKGWRRVMRGKIRKGDRIFYGDCNWSEECIGVIGMFASDFRIIRKKARKP